MKRANGLLYEHQMSLLHKTKPNNKGNEDLLSLASRCKTLVASK